MNRRTACFCYVPRCRTATHSSWRHPSVPGIGVLSVLAYVSTIEDPTRFARSRSVGAHMGLTPRQYQSGEVDRSGRISKCGDTLARTLLYDTSCHNR